MTDRRTYVCRDKKAPPGALPLLIRAGNPAQVRNHASRNQYEVSVATQDELVELVAKGVKREDAGTDPADTDEDE